MNHFGNLSCVYNEVHYRTSQMLLKLGDDNKVKSEDHERELKYYMYRRLNNIGALKKEHKDLPICEACNLLDDFRITITI